MKFPPKLAALAVVAVLSVAGLSAVTAALADNENRGPGMGMHHGGKKMCDRHGRGGPHGMRGSDMLAKKLSVMETIIGIRADQLDDWRDFTDALQATMARPMMGPGGMGPGGPGGPGPRMMAPDENAEPFSMAERLADNSIDRAKSAEALKSAIAKLRTTLTPEQLDKVKTIEARLRARMAQAHGWNRGHHGKGPHGWGPRAGEPGPDAAPAAQPDTPADSDDDDSDDGDNDDSL